MRLTLASKSEIRATLLRNALVPFEVQTVPVDEEMIKESLRAEGAKARDIADALAEIKAQRVSDKGISGMVLGCDQVLEFQGEIFSKPTDPEDVKSQLRRLGGNTHKLISAAVIVEDGRPVWRAISEARLTMRATNDAFLDGYIARNWDSIRHSVGGYKIEEEGARLFVQIFGDSFTVQGLPLLQLLQYLITRGEIEG